MEKLGTIDKAIQRFVANLEQQKNQEIAQGMVQEPMASFEKKLTYSSFLKNRMLIVQSIQHGVPYWLFEEIQLQTPFNEDDWAEFLNVSTKSLQRYKAAPEHIFKSIHSEKIFELAEVTELGKEIFDDQEKFYRWLSTRNAGLGGNKPSELIHNSYGKDLVIDTLYRIDHGVFA